MKELEISNSLSGIIAIYKKGLTKKQILDLDKILEFVYAEGAINGKYSIIKDKT